MSLKGDTPQRGIQAALRFKTLSLASEVPPIWDVGVSFDTPEICVHWEQ